MLILALSQAMDVQACAVCTGPVPKKTLDAYLLMTGLLSLLPMVLMAGLFFLFWRQSRSSSTPDKFPHPR